MYSASTVIESTHPSPPTARANGCRAASGLARAHATAKIGSGGATRSALVPLRPSSEKLRKLAPFFRSPVPIRPITGNAFVYLPTARERSAKRGGVRAPRAARLDRWHRMCSGCV
ncbi:hypothetical protein MTO96_010388 [Rhipicephalus appendiculatus]